MPAGSRSNLHQRAKCVGRRVHFEPAPRECIGFVEFAATQIAVNAEVEEALVNALAGFLDAALSPREPLFRATVLHTKLRHQQKAVRTRQVLRANADERVDIAVELRQRLHRVFELPARRLV
jgi:hypothetical protein